MIQPIPGGVSADTKEVEIATAWPSNGAYPLGRLLGQLYAIRAGVYIFTVGNVVALLSIPLALALYFLKVAPFIATRYTLTNRRVVVQKGLTARDDRWIELDRFDAIDLVVQPGQQWYDAGDLVFTKDGVERFRLPGVSRPQPFRHTCWSAHQSYVMIKAIRAQQEAAR